MGLQQIAAPPRYTYGDYRQWTGDERFELIEGVPHAMAPAPGRRHQEVLGEVYRQIATALHGQTELRLLPGLRIDWGLLAPG